MKKENQASATVDLAAAASGITGQVDDNNIIVPSRTQANIRRRQKEKAKVDADSTVEEHLHLTSNNFMAEKPPAKPPQDTKFKVKASTVTKKRRLSTEAHSNRGIDSLGGGKSRYRKLSKRK